MPLWEGSTQKDLATVNFYNEVLVKEPINMLVKRHGLFFAMLGKGEQLQYDRFEYEDYGTVGKLMGVRPRSQQIVRVSNKPYELPLFQYDPTFTALATHADELAPVQTNFDPNSMAIAKFEFGKYFLPIHIPGTLYEKEADNPKGFTDLIRLHADEVVEALYRKMCKEINSTQAQTRSTIGSWQHAISATTTYGTLERSTTKNVQWHGKVYTGTGALDIDDHVALDQARVAAEGGVPSVLTCNVQMYAEIQAQVRDRAHMVRVGEWDEFGGERVAFGRTVVCLDPYCDTDKYLLATPETWCMAMGEGSMARSGFEKDKTKANAYVMNTYAQLGFICKSPRHNLVRTGVTFA